LGNLKTFLEMNPNLACRIANRMAHVHYRETIQRPFQHGETNMASDKIDVADLDLVITKIDKRTSCGGAWVQGRINDTFRFDALVFAEHAESEEYELGRTKISKLWIQDIQTKKTLFNFDRGLDVPAATTEIQVVVDFLGCGLADLVWGT
jgi:hypothetical protein